MRSAAIVVVVALASAASSLRSQAAFVIPNEKDGYTITRSGETDIPAPAGYEGRTNTSTQTAVSKISATQGMSYVNHFRMKNENRTCPAADGTVEGDGEFSLSFDFKNMQPGGTGTIHIDMDTKATYKGTVGDDAFLTGPVHADIDYTYTLTTGGVWQGPGTRPAPVSAAQHFTSQFEVAAGANLPNIKPFQGGDPTNGNLEQAFSAAQALVFWAGFYYSVAETKWTQANTCVQVVFSPPSESRAPALGSETKVNAEIKTKSGEGVRGRFSGVEADVGGNVAIASSATDPGSPAIFTYTAPNKKMNIAGFKVDATSRGGVASAHWKTGLGTGWSGQINFSQVTEGDIGHDELQSWSNSEAARMTIDVKDGVGNAYVYYEGQNIAANKQKALRGGAITLIDAGHDNIQNHGEGGGPATLEINILPNGTYSLSVTVAAVGTGTIHSTTCTSENCTSTDRTYPVGSILPMITGKVDDTNHLQGSQNSTVSNLGRSRKGTKTVTLTWDLARQGTK